MAKQSGWTRTGIAIAVLLVLALIAHFAGGGISEFFGKLHGR
jgi:hypothetical protein